jgi:MerR family copper efflux transcriptional regulator
MPPAALDLRPGSKAYPRVVPTYTIGEAAAQSGFPASTLRYYETIGLVAPSARTDTGYRVYDDRALARLMFVARAKQLGCTLDEITELVGAWDGDRCEPVQLRLHELVSAKIGEVRDRSVELAAFDVQLRTAAAQLATASASGPCDDGCACLTASSPEIACTLDGDAAAEGRMGEWAAMLADVRARTTAPDGTIRLELDGDVSVAEVARLAVAEQQCCRFFAFAITVDERGVGLEVRAPAEASDVMTALFRTA